MISRKPSVSKIEGGLLDEHRAPLEPHPRVDVLLRERRHGAVGGEVELHEDEVPELDVAVTALAVRPAVRLATAVLGAPVVVELRAGAARAGLAGGAPEVLGARERHDALARKALPQPGGDGDLVLADAERRVTREHARPEPVGVELQMLGDELPRQVDGAVLEVVAEREVPEHLEHRRVSRGEPDLVEVGVLPARAQALLDGREPRRGRLLRTGEVRLQRLHPGGDEQRGRILRRRDQRERREPQMVSLLEEGEKTLAELCGRAHPPIVAPKPFAARGRCRARRPRQARQPPPGALPCPWCHAIRERRARVPRLRANYVPARARLPRRVVERDERRPALRHARSTQDPEPGPPRSIERRR